MLLPDTRRRLPSLGAEVWLGIGRSHLNSAVELGSPDARLSAHPQDSEWRTSSLGRTGAFIVGLVQASEDLNVSIYNFALVETDA